MTDTAANEGEGKLLPGAAPAYVVLDCDTKRLIRVLTHDEAKGYALAGHHFMVEAIVSTVPANAARGEEVRGLIAKWRAEAKPGIGSPQGDAYRLALGCCARELEAALSASARTDAAPWDDYEQAREWMRREAERCEFEAFNATGQHRNVVHAEAATYRRCYEALTKAALSASAPRGTGEAADVPRNKEVRVWSDMGPDGEGGAQLSLLIQSDGDVIIGIMDEDGRHSSVEFCTSGTRHPGLSGKLQRLVSDVMAMTQPHPAAAGPDELRALPPLPPKSVKHLKLAAQPDASLPAGELPDDVLVLAHQAATRYGQSVPESMEAMTTTDALRVIRKALMAQPDAGLCPTCGTADSMTCSNGFHYRPEPDAGRGGGVVEAARELVDCWDAWQRDGLEVDDGRPESQALSARESRAMDTLRTALAARTDGGGGEADGVVRALEDLAKGWRTRATEYRGWSFDSTDFDASGSLGDKAEVYDHCADALCEALAAARAGRQA